MSSTTTATSDPATSETQKAGSDNVLSVVNVTVRFGGVAANDGVSLDCQDGGITALLGPNGAGKTTLFDVITGARRNHTGRVFFSGRDVTHLPPYARARLGMARTFQNISVSREMTVADNVVVGAARFLNYGVLASMLRLPRVRKNDEIVRAVAQRAIEVMGLSRVAHFPAGDLPYGDIRRLEIARALALAPRVLLLDEPAAGMDRTETLKLARGLTAARERWNISLLVVEHDLDFVRAVAERAVALDFGRVIAAGSVDEVLADQDVRDAYIGTARHA